MFSFFWGGEGGCILCLLLFRNEFAHLKRAFERVQNYVQEDFRALKDNTSVIYNKRNERIILQGVYSLVLQSWY